jgi:hypothetical protein
MALPTDILWPYCNNVTEMTCVHVGSSGFLIVIVCSNMYNTYAVTKQVSSGLTCVQALFKSQLEFRPRFSVFPSQSPYR